MAETEYAQVLNHEPDRPRVLVQYGHALKERGNHTLAAQAYKRALDLDPEDLDAADHLLHLYRQMGLNTEAETVSAKFTPVDVLALRPRTPGRPPRPLGLARLWQLMLARRAYQRGDWSAARARYENLIRRAPGRGALWAELAGVHEGRFDLARAWFAYAEALRLDPMEPDIYFRLGSVLKRLGQDGLSDSMYVRAFQLKPNDPAAREAVRCNGRLDDDLARLVEDSEFKPMARTGLSVLTAPTLLAAKWAATRGNWFVAARRYEHFLRRNHGYWPGWVRLGHALKACGNLHDAQYAYLTAMALAPDDADVRLQLGHLRKLMGRSPAAGRAHRQALELDPGALTTRTEPERFHSETREPPTSPSATQDLSMQSSSTDTDNPSLFESAHAAAPKSAPQWTRYGHALMEAGQPEEAEQAYRTAIALDPTQPEIHVRLGRLLDLTDRRAEAGDAYLNALRLDRSFDPALDGVEALLRQGVKLPAEAIRAALSGEAAGGEGAATAFLAQQSHLRAAKLAMGRVMETDLLDREGLAAIKSALALIEDQLSAPGERVQPATARLAFDVADLLGYYRNARLPTGIQRVQIEVVRSLLLGGSRSHEVMVCAFVESQDDWVEIPSRLFIEMSEASLESGDLTDPRWINIIRRLDLTLLCSRPVEFPEGVTLVNLGTSWWLQNYFLHVRTGKARRRIKYVPFVHDFIPVMTPEHCVRPLTQDFITWVLGVFQHADMFLVNSESTKRDLIAVAETLGHNVSSRDIEVVRLDADFRRPSPSEAPATLPREWGLKPGRYVLIVSTIESRKNHLGAFNAWLALMEKYGADAIPDLVCVGNAGWLNADVHAKIASSPDLQAKVKMLSRLSDDALVALYQNCLFTLYPSNYEGWGLPVTESLCYGKMVLASDSSSLPEAGGVFADYFSAGSDRGLADAAERLIFDDAYRARREAQIREAFKPRRWSEIGEQIGVAVSRLDEQSNQGDPPGRLRAAEPMTANLGTYYPIVRNFERRLWRGMVLGEMFRAGAGWWWPDDWGVWTKPQGGQIAIRLEGPHGALRVWLRIRGVLDGPCRWSFEVTSPQRVRPQTGVLGPDEWRWLQVDLPGAETDTNFLATLLADQSQDLATRTGGLDGRITSLGLAGFYICERENLADRVAFSEAVLMNDFMPLTPGFEARMAFGRDPG